jgi:hypothetical protein
MTDYGRYRIRLKKPLDHAATVKSVQPYVERLALALSRAQSKEYGGTAKANREALDCYCALVDKMADSKTRHLLR